MILFLVNSVGDMHHGTCFTSTRPLIAKLKMELCNRGVGSQHSPTEYICKHIKFQEQFGETLVLNVR